MKQRYYYLIIVVFLMLGFLHHISAQNLAQEAYAIFEQSCLICHGENGSYRESLIIEHNALIDDGKIIPGDPEGSIFYQRLIETNIAKRMPLGQPPLSTEAIETIRQWIAEGAPDWNAIPNPTPNFITTEVMLQRIETHINSLSSRDRSFARYFTLTHLHNAGETAEVLNAYRRALSKLINSLSWGREVVKPQSIDAEQTLFYIDLRDYEWDVRNDAWAQIEQKYPYNIPFDAPSQTHLLEKLRTLQQEMNCNVPFVHVDWFLATASLPPLYHDILALPDTDRELEAALEVFVSENLQNAPGKRVWRAGFNDSGVSRHNRVVERHISRYGAYWKSYDFAGSADSQNIFTHPLDFSHDGGEIIFNLPNGLQAYYLVDGDGIRLDVAPTEIVSNPAVSDPAVRNGLSCIGCHTEGMKTFEDEVRAVVEQADNPSFNKVRALDLYVEKSIMDDLVAEDTQRYRAALEAAGGVFGGIEPVQRFYETFQGTLSAAHAAAAVGLETETFLEKVSKNTTLQNLLGALVLENGAIKRDAWTSAFHDVIDALNTPDSDLPPVVERPDRIPGTGVYIPDMNLRAAIAGVLEKSIDEPITIKEMESFRKLDLVSELTSSKKIKDLTGLEYAINLEILWISNNEVSDLSPLAGLTKMIQMSMEHNPITSFSALTNMEELQGIQISHNNIINDITPLAGKAKLRGVLIWGCPITDISPLTDLPSIEYIDLCGNQISEIPSFENAPKLKKLYIYNNKVSDVSILKNHTQLERLNLRDNNITDISALAALTNLKWIDLTNNPITDFSPLAELSQTTNIIAGDVNIPDRNLRAAIADALGKDITGVLPITFEDMATLTTLRASDKDIKDLTGLESAINLTELRIGHNPISDLSPIATLIKLRTISFYNTQATDLLPLTSLHNLEEISADHTRISNLDPLAGLKKLRKLDTVGSDISDLSPLAGLTNLTRLRLYDCQATDISPLKGLTKLRWLGLTHTDNISDLSPLSGLTDLEHLALSDTEISDLAPLAGLVNLETLILNENRIVDVSPLASLRNLKNLQLHYNNISDLSPLVGIRETIEVFTWFGNPVFPQGGPNIEGPWLWLTLPVKADKNVDYLAQASDNKSTEQQVATLGASEGTVIGNRAWSVGMLEAYQPNNSSMDNKTNLKRLLDSQDAITPNAYGQTLVVYGSMTLYSPRIQQTQIFIGASVAQKIYLNGELVHQDYTDYAFGSHNVGYRTFFPVTLQRGKNVFLVRLDGFKAHYDKLSLFFGFEPGAEYTVLTPGVGFTFNVTETDLRADDTFTLNLNAENIINLGGWQADIVFDPEALEAVEVTEGDFLKAEGENTFFQDGTIDNTAGKITSLYSARISESGASGTGTLLSVTFKAKTGGETYVTLENFEFSSITGDIIPAVPPNITITVGEYPAWDVNQDGRVSIQDLVLVARDLGSGSPANLRTDVNRDGVINIQDLILVATHIGESTDTNAAPTILTMENKELTPAVVQTWIDQAKREDDGSLAFRQGIENLEKLLTSLIPEKTALLANYPNPFNPETWIPYQLAAPADVTLTIYAIDGSVVRTLALGHQLPGIYQNRSRAAHWDGKNAVGEPVASGLYFHTLTAGDFTATCKMLIKK